MPSLRRFRPGDEPALAEICVATADNGGNARGVLTDDALWAEIFVLPYVTRHPEHALVVQGEDGEACGYLVAAPDTRAFEEWFAQEWWPTRAARWNAAPEINERMAGLLTYAGARRAGAEPYGDDYPAHLHIDLLPVLQGQGWGRRLINTMAVQLRGEGVSGLHLVAADTNLAALAFYDRLGFTRLPSHSGAQAFARTL